MRPESPRAAVHPPSPWPRRGLGRAGGRHRPPDTASRPTLGHSEREQSTEEDKKQQNRGGGAWLPCARRWRTPRTKGDAKHPRPWTERRKVSRLPGVARPKLRIAPLAPRACSACAHVPGRDGRCDGSIPVVRSASGLGGRCRNRCPATPCRGPGRADGVVGDALPTPTFTPCRWRCG